MAGTVCPTHIAQLATNALHFHFPDPTEEKPFKDGRYADRAKLVWPSSATAKLRKTNWSCVEATPMWFCGSMSGGS